MDAAWDVVEGDTLVSSDNPAFPEDLQPRERKDRSAMQMQVVGMAGNLNPEQLGYSAEADRGAPVIGPDLVVESGNGRVGAILSAYARHPEKAAAYRAFIERSTGRSTAGMRNPVLVRRRTSDVNRRQFVIEANETSTARMSSAEQARADADMLTPEMVIRPGVAGDGPAAPGPRSDTARPESGSQGAENTDAADQGVAPDADSGQDSGHNLDRGADTTSADAGSSGVSQQQGSGAGKRRAGRPNLGGTKRAHTAKAVTSSLFHQVFLDAGMDPEEANLLPADEKFNLLVDSLKKRFGFSKVERGPGHNWKESVDAALDAYHNLRDMMAAIGLPLNAASLGGRIQLMFDKAGNGALGWYMALSGRGVLAVGRRNSSFGHEWGHGLDHHLLDLSGAINQALIKGRLLTGKLRQKLDTSNMDPDLLTAMQTLLFRMYGGNAAKAALVRTLELRLEKETDADNAKVIEDQLAKARGTSSGKSSFYVGALALSGAKAGPFETGGSEGYWQRPTEMFARAVEAWLSERMELIGADTSFVAKGTPLYTKEGVDFFQKAYPQAAEREAIFAALDDLVAIIRNKEIYGKEKPPRPNSEDADFRAFDPRNWPKDRMFAVDPSENAFQRIVNALRTAIRETLPTMKSEWAALRDSAGSVQWAGTKAALWAVEKSVGSLVYTGRGILLMLEKMHPNSAGMRQIVRMFATQPGTGKLSAQTYSESVTLRVQRWNTLRAKVLEKHQYGKATKAEQKAFSDVMSGIRAPDTVPVWIRNLASDMRATQDLIWDEATSAGVDMGYTKEQYLHRIYDDSKIEQDREGFIRAATAAYESLLTREWEDTHDVAQDPLPDDIDKQAAKLAREWYISRAISDETGSSKATAASSATASRRFGPQEEALLADYMVADPLERMDVYALQMARRVAWTERFGADGQGYLDLIRQLGAEGLNNKEINTVLRVISIARGHRTSITPSLSHSFLAYLHVVGLIRLLPRALWSNLSEPVLAAMHTRDVRDAGRALVNTMRVLFRTDKGLALKNFGEAMGLLASSLPDQIQANRYGTTFMGDRGAAKLGTMFFQRTGIGQLTEAQRAGVLGVGAAYLQKIAARLMADRKAGRRGRTTAVAELAEYGVSPGVADAFAKWITENDAMDIDTVQQAPQAMQDLWLGALHRFSTQVIQSPEAIDMPMVAATDIGKFLFAIMRFQYAFQRNVIIRSGHLMEAGVTGKYGGARLTPAERLNQFGLGMIPAITAVYAVQFGFSILRDLLFGTLGSGDDDKDKDKDLVDKIFSKDSALRAVSRGGWTGAFDPGVNMVTGLRYQRDFATTLVGPILGTNLQSSAALVKWAFQNSPNTNTTEFNAIRGLYDFAAAPAINTALSVLPGGKLAAPVYSAGMQYLTSPSMSKNVAEALVGPKGTKTGPAAEKDAQKNQWGPQADWSGAQAKKDRKNKDTQWRGF